MLPGLQQPVETMPEVDFGNSYQVEFLARYRAGESAGDAGEIYSVGYADGGATEIRVIAGEGYNEIDVPAERMAETVCPYNCTFSMPEEYSWS